MRRSRVISSTILIVLIGGMAALAVLASHAQTPDPSRFVVLEGVGLPAVELNTAMEAPYSPASAAGARRAALGAALHAAVTRSTAPYTPGRVIVKFRSDASDAARVDA